MLDENLLKHTNMYIYMCVCVCVCTYKCVCVCVLGSYPYANEAVICILKDEGRNLNNNQ